MRAQQSSPRSGGAGSCSSSRRSNNGERRRRRLRLLPPLLRLRRKRLLPLRNKLLQLLRSKRKYTLPGPAIKAETREVRVDVVVTDRREIHQDLTTKDFHLYEDDKEQQINTFSFGAAPNGHYRGATPLHRGVLR